MTLQLADAEVRRLLPLEPLIGAVREALIDLSAGRVVQPLRTVIEIAAEDGLLFVKPVLARGILATKLITQLPLNAERGLPTLLATIVLPRLYEVFVGPLSFTDRFLSGLVIAVAAGIGLCFLFRSSAQNQQ